MGSIVDGIFGGDDAAEDAADAQVKASEASIEFQKEALEQIRGDLAPFRDAGETGITPLVDLITNPQAQIDFLNNNPIFTAANDEINRVVTANQAWAAVFCVAVPVCAAAFCPIVTRFCNAPCC